MAQINKLSALAVKHATKTIGDGGGLWLKVQAGNRKSWVFRYRINGKNREIGLGATSSVPLMRARDKAAEYRLLLIDRIDPLEKRKSDELAQALQRSRNLTFDECATQYVDSMQAEWRNQKHVQQWRATLKTYASPHIGHVPVAEITVDQVKAVLNPIWQTKTETATRVRQRIEQVLDWAKASKYREGDNPAAWAGNLAKLLPKPSKIRKVQHHGAMPYVEAAEFMTRLRAHHSISSKALEFTILTAARTGSVIGAHWSEIDFDNQVWTIPAERMKNEKPFEIPLCKDAMVLLESMPVIDGSPFIFTGHRDGKHLSNIAMLKLLKESFKYPDLTVHGFRSTFRDWAAEQTGHPRLVIETAMSHQIKDKAEAAYLRSNMLEKRRTLMESWASYLKNTGTKAEVVNFRSAG